MKFKLLIVAMSIGMSLNAQVQFKKVEKRKDQMFPSKPSVVNYANPQFIDVTGDGIPEMISSGRLRRINIYERDSETQGYNDITNSLPEFQNGISSVSYGIAVGDIDGDLDSDIVIGQYEEVVVYINNGDQGFTLATAANDPFSGLMFFDSVTPALVDLNGDDKLDLVAGNVHEGEVYYYENNGTGDFVQKVFADNPFLGLDINGSWVSPSFFDYDNDDDFDLLLGLEDGDYTLYINNNGVFDLVDSSSNPFSGMNVGHYASSNQIDYDNDNDLDLFVGNFDGEFAYYENKGGYEFKLITGENNPFYGFHSGNYSTPVFGDFDNDGFEELISVKYYETYGAFPGSELIHYENNNGSFISYLPFKKDTILGHINFNYTGAPTLVNLEGDGKLEIVIGDFWGGFYYVVKEGDSVYKEVPIKDSPFNDVEFGFGGVAPYFIDVDNDKDLDFVYVSDYEIEVFLNEESKYREATTEENPFSKIVYGFAENIKLAFEDLDTDGDLDLVVGKSYGGIDCFINVGDFVFEKLEGPENPFSGINVGRNAFPAFYDLNEDGGKDLIVGNRDGVFQEFIRSGEWVVGISDKHESQSSSVYIASHNIITWGVKGDFSIYRLDGGIVLEGFSEGGNYNIPKLSSGMYLIKHNNEIDRLIVE